MSVRLSPKSGILYKLSSMSPFRLLMSSRFNVSSSPFSLINLTASSSKGSVYIYLLETSTVAWTSLIEQSVLTYLVNSGSVFCSCTKLLTSKLLLLIFMRLATSSGLSNFTMLGSLCLFIVLTYFLSLGLMCYNFPFLNSSVGSTSRFMSPNWFWISSNVNGGWRPFASQNAISSFIFDL